MTKAVKTVQNMSKEYRRVFARVKGKHYDLPRDKSGKVILPDEKEVKK